MSACAECKFAALCLSSSDFKASIVRCEVCGHFRIHPRKPRNILAVKDIDPPPCLHIPRLPRNRCHFCKKGAHHRVRFVWRDPTEPTTIAWSNVATDWRNKHTHTSMPGPVSPPPADMNNVLKAIGVPRKYLGLPDDDE